MKRTIISSIFVGCILSTAAQASAQDSLLPAPLRADRAALSYVSLCRDGVFGISAAESDRLEADATCSALLTRAKSFCSDPLGAPSVSRAELQALQTSAQTKVSACHSDRIRELKGDRGDQIAGSSALAWQDTVIRGTASFIERRFEAELTLMLQERVRDELCETKEGKKVLPSACAILAATKGVAAPPAWAALKSALERDLEAMPVTLLDHALAPHLPPDLVEGLTTVFQVVRALEQSEKLVEVLAGLEVKFSKGTCATQDARCVFSLLGASVATVGRDIGSPLPAEDLALFGKVSLSKLIESHPAELAFLNDPAKRDVRVRALIRLRKQLENAANLGKAALKLEKEPYEERLRAFSAYARAISPMVQTTTVLLTGNEEVPPCDGGGVGCLALIAEAAKTAVDVTEAIRAKDYVAGAVAVLSFAHHAGASAKLPAWVSKHLMFAAGLASAQSPEAVQEVLENAAAPVGAYKVKRQDGNYSINVTAFAGVQAGGEWILGEGPAGRDPVGHLGFFAPIGVDLTVGKGDAASIGLFLSLIDLGALTDFRLGEGDSDPTTEVESAPKIGFGQVFSPGAFIVLGVGETPITLGGGVALAPRLREISTVGTDDRSEASALRVSGFVALDLTLFPLMR
ncbi:MAG TPA: hypothetical protein VLS89_17645 [Candidatus Nanopelagicales bacterium]|nr:hypothetical protein [Candidatus Nanopelagicales bacterium]